MNRAGEFLEEESVHTVDVVSTDTPEQQPAPDKDGINGLLKAKAENDAHKASKERLTDEQMQERYETTVRQLEAKYGSQIFKYNTHQGTVTEMLQVCRAIRDIAFDNGFDATVRTIERYRVDEVVEEDIDKEDEPQTHAENELKNSGSRDETKTTSRTEPALPSHKTVVESPSRLVAAPAVIPAPALEPALIHPPEREVQAVNNDEAGEVNRAADEKSEGSNNVSGAEHASDGSENLSRAESSDDPVRQTTEHVSISDTPNKAVAEVHIQDQESSGGDALPVRSAETTAPYKPIHEEQQAVLVDVPLVTHEETESIHVIESSENETSDHVEHSIDILTEEDARAAEIPLESETASLPFEPVIETAEVQNLKTVSAEDVAEHDAQTIAQENMTKVESETSDESHDVLQEQFAATDDIPVHIEQARQEELFVSSEERGVEELKPITALEIEHAIDTFRSYAAENVPAEELLVSIAEHAQQVAEREPDTELIDATDEEKEAVTYELQLLIERTRTVRETSDLLLSAQTKEECETYVSELVESLASLLRSLGYENPEKMVGQLIASYSVESLRALLYELEASLRRAAASEIAGRRSILREDRKLRHSRVGKIVLSIIEAFSLKQTSLEVA